MAECRVFYTDSSKISSIPISPGQVIFCENNRSVYFDNQENKRINYSLVLDLGSELERISLQNPSPAIYFVKESGILWKYSNGWIQLTNEPTSQIVFDNYASFPEQGVGSKIYVDGDKMYKWMTDHYQLMNPKHDVWENIPAVD